MPSIEKQVAATVLQKPIEETIGGETYQIAPPSCATIILASELVAQLPAIQLNPENIASETLYVAKDCRILGDLLAVLILGAKGLSETIIMPETIEKTVEKIVYDEYLFGLIKRPKKIPVTITETVEKEVEVDKQAELAKKLLLDVGPKEIRSAVARLLDKLEIGDFFGFTTSLLEINLLRQTREVTTTAFGQSSPEQ